MIKNLIKFLCKISLIMLEYNYREKEAVQKQDLFSEFQAAALKAVD
ncbi:hypothetical protein [Lactobacillus xylocopicola]|nr:hypothetical protein [Lactobacillus xylocopicola]